jgi:integrase
MSCQKANLSSGAETPFAGDNPTLVILTDRNDLDDQLFATFSLCRDLIRQKQEPTTTAALKLMALLFPRPGELRLAEWKEFDLDKDLWTIPASRTKMRREHRVPLPRQALTILRELHPVTGYAALVFPGLRSVKRPISENTLNGALRRMGYTPQTNGKAERFIKTALNEWAYARIYPNS